MIQNGHTAAQIARSIEVYPATLYNYLRRHGLRARDAIHDHSEWKHHGRVGACEKHHKTVKAMAENGSTMKAIAHVVGTNHTRVREYLKRHEIQRPPWRNPPGDHPMSRNTSGSMNSAWKGGRCTDKDGYILLWMPEHPDANAHGYVREHRTVMARMLGRPLLQSEVVDHRNDIRNDNRPENLRLFASNGEHLSVTLTGRKSRASRDLPPSIRRKSATSGRQSSESFDQKPKRSGRAQPSPS